MGERFGAAPMLTSTAVMKMRVSLTLIDSDTAGLGVLLLLFINATTMQLLPEVSLYKSTDRAWPSIYYSNR